MNPSLVAALLPEIWLGLLFALLLVLDLAWKEERSTLLGAVAALGLLPLLPILGWQVGLGDHELLGGMYRLDLLALFFKGIFAVAAVLVVLMTRELDKTIPRGHGEFYLLILAATFGMFLAASAAHFVMLFVALELISITFYVLTAYLQNNMSSLESGMKYLVLGSLASGILLYGVAFIYGSTGSMQFGRIQALTSSAASLPAPLLFGLLLVVSGLLFKAAAVPFQLWVPDVYQGAPTPVAAFLSVGSKSAGFLVLFRVFQELFIFQWAQWTPLLVWVAGLTILYGNLGAIPQRNLKRLLGYSSIGHAGYLLIGLAAATQLGFTAVNFYLASYLFTNLAVFLVIAAFSRAVESDEIRAYAGLSKRSPFLAAAMFIALLSLAGVPPLAGFFGKFLLLMGAVAKGYLALAIIGAAAVVVSLYYYLQIVYTMYAEKPEDPSPIAVSLPVRLALWVCLAAMLGLGIWQGPLLQLSFAAISGS
jgi:NADH-quinone oxidoreductase subunit N